MSWLLTFRATGTNAPILADRRPPQIHKRPIGIRSCLASHPILDLFPTQRMAPAVVLPGYSTARALYPPFPPPANSRPSVSFFSNTGTTALILPRARRDIDGVEASERPVVRCWIPILQPRRNCDIAYPASTPRTACGDRLHAIPYRTQTSACVAAAL